MVAAIAIFLLGSLVYSNTFGVPFAFDDHRNLVDNPAIRWTALDWSWAERAVRNSPSRRPLANLSFGLNYYFDRYEVGGYHAVNLAIHLVVSWLVFALAWSTFERCSQMVSEPNAVSRQGAVPLPRSLQWAAVFAGLLFVAHPLQTQSVTYIVQRMNSLATLFYLAALLFYIRGRTAQVGRRRTAAFTAGLLCWGLALGSKQNALTLPLAVWLYEWFFFRNLDLGWVRRSAGWVGIPLALAAAGLYYAVVWGPDFGYAQRDFTMGERVLTQLRVVAFYIRLLLFPYPGHLSLIHEIETSHSLFDPPTTFASLVAIGMLLGAAVVLARRRRLLSFAIAWFFLHLVLESSILPLEMVYEHRTYLPSVGLALLGAYALFSFFEKRGGARAALAVAVGILAVSGVATWQRNEVWRSEVTLWSDVLAKYPKSARAHTNLGAAFGVERDFDTALHHHREALRIDPTFLKAQLNIGKAYAMKGMPAEAHAAFAAALHLAPLDPEAHASLGATLAGQGEFDEAIAHFETALALRPGHARTERNLGTALIARGRFEEAERVLRRVARREPSQPDVHDRLGRALEGLGRLEEARAEFALAVKLSPDHPVAPRNLARVEARLKNRSKRQ